MSVEMEKASDFLKNHGICADAINPDSVLADFESEMTAGLEGRESSLAMIPTYITINKEVPVDEPVIVMDAGGTNLRVAVVTVDENGKTKMGDFSKSRMPGLDEELGKDQFFKQFAGFIEPVVDKAEKIGMCFSYPAEISPDCDGKLIRWTKEVKAPEVEGEFIGKGTLEALGEKGEGKKITVLNDTIATLLAGKSTDQGRYSSYVGFILGTGTNIAYVESNSNIGKLSGLDPDGSQAINIESGNFNKAPRGDIDITLDEASPDTGRQCLEKMISGLHLGRIAHAALEKAHEEGLISDEFNELLESLDEIVPRDTDFFLAGSDEGAIKSSTLSEADREFTTALFQGIIARAAKLAAINISAAVIKSGAGKEPDGPVCVNIDGSTYYKTTDFKVTAEKYLEEILGPRGIAYDLIQVDEAPVVGAAVAGLTN